MKRGICLLLLCFGCGCASAPLMRDSGFQAIAVGSSIDQVKATYGEPYEVRPLPNGTEEVVYIQRVECGSSAIEQTEYTFQVCQGTIVGKHRKQLGSSTLQFSY